MKVCPHCNKKMPERQLSVEEIDNILLISAYYFGYTLEQIKNHDRREVISIPRHMITYYACKSLDYEPAFIGNKLGGRDLSTVNNSLRRVSGYLDVNSQEAEQYQKFKEYMNAVIYNVYAA